MGISRSENMRRIRNKDTSPERKVRSLVHRLGYRFRLHSRKLPGKPDLVFASRKKIIFVHGCFWHQHGAPGCKIARVPKTRLDYWVPKLERNKSRDLENQKELQRLGWKLMVVWECEIKDLETLANRIREFLG